MDNDEKATVGFIDGYLFSMANFCHGCNYAPFYGAEELIIENKDIKNALVQKLGKDGFSNLSLIEQSTLPVLLDKWLGKKLLEGKPLENNISLRELLWQHNSYLLEFIEDIVSNRYKMYSFNIEHEDYGRGAEALGFYGNNKSLYLYFGWSD